MVTTLSIELQIDILKSSLVKCLEVRERFLQMNGTIISHSHRVIYF